MAAEPGKKTKRQLRREAEQAEDAELIAEEARRVVDEAPPLPPAARAKLRELRLGQVLAKVRKRGR